MATRSVNAAEQEFLRSAIAHLREHKLLADRAIAQVSDEDLREPLPGDRNSIAIIMKHVVGNMLSRWTDFLTTDGEKPWRDRDGEFVDEFNSRAEVRSMWERGWFQTFKALESLTPDDLTKTITIRGESQSVIHAINRQLVHYGYHIGQIILIARIHVGEANWKTLTIPRGGSEQYDTSVGYGRPGS